MGVDVLIARNERLLLSGSNQLQIPAPLILDPRGVIILVVRADSQHDACGVEGCKDIRLVFLPELILQRDAGEEHAIALFRQRII